MSITDEDLQFMADDMWKDALLPDLPGMYGFTDEEDSGAAAAAAPGDRLLDPPSEINGESSVSNRAGSTSAVKKATPTVKAVKLAKGKGKDVAMASPSTDLYLSSPALARPKKDRKLSKSMKGASQNESQQEKRPRLPKPHKTNPIFSELETVPGDPYGLPISPTQTVAVAVSNKKKAASPAASAAKAKASSPVGLTGGSIPTSQMKPTKPQKRVAKRSFLDPPSSPAQVTQVEAMPVPPLKTTPKEAFGAHAAKQPAKAAAKKPAAPKKPAKPKEAKKETKKAVARPPAAKKEKTTADPALEADMSVKEPKTAAPRASVVKMEKTAAEPEDEWAAPVDVDGVISNEDVTKKLRPRSERVPIIISSDAESSYGEDGDDDGSDSGYAPHTGTTTMTTPLAQMDAPVSTLAVAGQKIKIPAAFAKSVVPAQNQALEGVDKSDTRGRNASMLSVQPLEKQHLDKEHRANSHKRSRSPSAGPSHQATKKQRTEPSRTDKAKALVQPTVSNDPFVENQAEHEHMHQHQTHFTAKLLQSAAPAAVKLPRTYTIPKESFDRLPDVPRELLHKVPRSHQEPCLEPCLEPGRVPSTSLATHGYARNKARASDGDGIARQMMQLLTEGARANTADQQALSPRSKWLDETDPYKETSQIMSYVCRTVLRFLKSKEAAIEDVADEYRQRGSAVLSRVEALHSAERCALANRFEQRRQQSLAVFESARRDVQLLAAKLEQVNLVPVIQNVLADDAGARMRALQA
ncbi:hypothetical protein SCUCBS95973_007884 [Sporothrix curviconia]|uniref:Uncharacterized protein n=1 Tax=Sporothrix curviconia TaxID=1260050 RepID=A0ABP0CIY7_9PEZI